MNNQKNGLAKMDAAKSRNVQAIIPQNTDDIQAMATFMVKNRMVPKAYDNESKVTIAIMKGLELGMMPLRAVQSLYVVNGVPTIYGDAAVAMVRGTGFVEYMTETMERGEDEEGNECLTAICTVKRRGEEREEVRKFSSLDAKRAGLWGKAGPWKSYPKRMLQMRARGFALRDVFPDCLHGLAITEEHADYPGVTASVDKQGNMTLSDGDQRVDDPLADDVVDTTATEVPDDTGPQAAALEWEEGPEGYRSGRYIIRALDDAEWDLFKDDSIAPLHTGDLDACKLAAAWDAANEGAE